MPEPDIHERLRFFEDYVALNLPGFRTEQGALGRVKKFSGYYTRSLPGGAALRQEIFHSKTLEEALYAFRRWYEVMASRPHEEPLVQADDAL